MMIYAIHSPQADKLSQIIEQMRALGAPKIEVVDCGDYYMALEGSHRLAAAAHLGLVPELQIRARDEMLDISGYDWYDAANWAETRYPAGDVAGELYSVQAVNYRFEIV